ncbi:putative amino acid transporter [Carbonactinospora thermoautotrophica]|uniref:Putative amino acid transporter n=1 Tax=Carbonactinospora thermoautotrophica TaxID=1469144 RepID=A0A132MYQ7_9ACTN|nr:APC family permease [Carbonactinospora thermoautotrophica]KWX03045.1 putative amino acid transporter [Carbonactinospora thermoautotrophica]
MKRSAPDPGTRLDRRIGTADAVVMGLGSMLGTGVLVVFAPAAARAGIGLFVGLLLAAFVAYANATSAAQLAAVHPMSGGAYVYGRARLSPAWGALAGYAFVLGKTASCAAAALAVGAYAWPEHPRLLAVIAVVATTALNYLGVTKTVGVTRILVAALLIVLAVVVVTGFSAPGPDPTGARDIAPTLPGILGAGALLFFAFAGYARIATLGEEVRDPARTIPRAVLIALGITLVVYGLVGLAAVHALGVWRLAHARAPLVDVVSVAGHAWLTPVVRAGGAMAASAVLISLVAGVSRTVFAMGAERDLPAWLAAVHPVRRVPHRAELLVGAVTLGIVLLGGLVGAVAFSAFTVLLYYAVTNASALRLAPEERRYPRWLAGLGLLGCLALSFASPPQIVLAGSAALAVLLLARIVVLRQCWSG